VQVRLVLLGCPLLLGQNQEEAVEELSLVEAHEIGNIDVFHAAEKINAIGSTSETVHRALWCVKRLGHACDGS
jgi:hypothetical protein